jgi:hypothetical protein
MLDATHAYGLASAPTAVGMTESHSRNQACQVARVEAYANGRSPALATPSDGDSRGTTGDGGQNLADRASQRFRALAALRSTPLHAGGRDRASCHTSDTQGGQQRSTGVTPDHDWPQVKGLDQGVIGGFPSSHSRTGASGGPCSGMIPRLGTRAVGHQGGTGYPLPYPLPCGGLTPRVCH